MAKSQEKKKTAKRRRTDSQKLKKHFRDTDNKVKKALRIFKRHKGYASYFSKLVDCYNDPQRFFTPGQARRFGEGKDNEQHIAIGKSQAQLCANAQTNPNGTPDTLVSIRVEKALREV